MARKTSSRRRDEIVEEIVDNLRPWKNRMSIAAVTADVSHELNILAKLVPLQKKLFNRIANRAHARKLDSALGKVETLLTSSPGALAFLLFDPLPPVTLTHDGELIQARSSLDNIERTYLTRANSFVAELRRLRKVCARAIHPGFGSHPNYDHAKGACAWFALGLMRGLSDAKITGSENAAFRIITSLAYEAVSGRSETFM